MNKIAKCVCSGILALMIGLGSFCAFGAVEQNTLSKEMQNSMEVLRLLGFITDYYDYNTLMSEKVTRADFANTVAKLVDATEYTDDSMYYYDVPKNHYAYKSICALTEMGVINGIGTNRFEPETPISVGEAYKILLSLMGYDRRAESDGGYPVGYIQTARSLRIYDGSSATDSLTRSSMLSAIYRAMKTKIFTPTSFNDNGKGVKYQISDEETLLSIYHSIYYDKGTVNAAELSSIDGSIPAEPEEVKIDNVIYDSDVSLTEELGEDVEFFYHYDKTKEERNILWAKSTGNTEIVKIEEEALGGFDRNSFTLSYYDKSDKVRKLTLNRDITVLYNGREVSDNIHEIFEMPEYSVKFTKEKGKFTAAIVQKADTYVIGSVNTADTVIYDKANPNFRLSLEENSYDYLSVKDTSGTNLTFGELAEGMVLSVYTAEDSRYMKVLVSSAKISGLVQRISPAAKGNHLYIGDNVYLLPAASSVPLPSVGENVMVYIDHKGNAAYVETIAGDYFAAYVCRAGTQDGVFDSRPIFKVFHQDGKMMILECADKVVCDGVKQTKAEDIIAVFNEVWGSKNSSFKPQMALIKLNSEGKINEIDTAYVNSSEESVSDSLSLHLPLSTLTYKWTGFFEGRAIIGANTVVFNVPPDAAIASASDKEFSIKKKDDFADNTSYTIETYKTKERVGYEQFIILKSKLGSSWDANELPFLVKDVAQVLDDDGVPIDALVGYNGTEEVTLAGDGDISFDSIKQGMLVRIKQNFSKQIEDIEVLFDPESDLDSDGKIKPDKQTNSQFGEPYGLVRGYVNDVVGGIVKISRTDPAVVDQMADKQAAPVLIYDARDKRTPIRTGSFQDARTYYNDGDDCSVIIMQSYYGTPKMFVIYK